MSTRWPGIGLRVVGVGLLVWLALRRPATGGGPWWLTALVAVAVVGLVVGWVWMDARQHQLRRSRLAVTRPDLTTHAVWADATFAQAVRELGDDPGSIRTGTRLTLAWSSRGVEVLQDERVIVSVPWDQVWTITQTDGRASSTTNPAVEVITRRSVRIVVVPARKAAGGLLPARRSAVGLLVARLRDAHREAVEEPRVEPDA